MAVTAALVKELRERTGAGMMDCKKALVAVDGDIEAAIDHLRKTGLAKADKKASRIAAEGKIVLALSSDGGSAVMVEINSETDFVAKDDHFLSFSQAVAERALAGAPADLDGLLSLPLTEGGTETLEQARQTLITKIGENIQVRQFERLDSEGGRIGAYVHGGRIGVLVDIEGGDDALARDLAMHVAAINPQYVDADAVPAEQLSKEKDILVAQAQDSGKPPEIIEKMVQGRLRKYLAEITLLGQPFVKDGDVTVEKLLAAQNAKVRSFVRLVVGEGIEKKADDFAAEVMAQARS